MDIALLEKLLKCPLCGNELSFQEPVFSCKNNHCFQCQKNFIDFSVVHERNETQEHSKRSFETEWCRYYPRLGWHSRELAHEKDMFLSYTKAMPNFFFNKIVIDAGCGNGRYINIVNAICSIRPRLLMGIELSNNALLASRNCAKFDNVVILKMDLNDLPKILREPVDYIYSIGVLHHTPDAAGAFRNLAKCVRFDGFFSVFLYGKGNPILYRVNSFLRNKLFSKWPHKVVYWICVMIAIPCQIFRVKQVGSWAREVINRFIYVDSNIHNMFDAYTAGWTSFHERDEVEQWYRENQFDCVVSAFINYTSLYCIGRRIGE
jgi:SAM-dependent methyltransferase